MRTLVLLIAGFVAWVSAPAAALAGALFSDGYLGLTQEELRAKLGQPQKIRDRSAALRVYKYYAYDEWENVLKDQIPGALGEDVSRRVVECGSQCLASTPLSTRARRASPAQRLKGRRNACGGLGRAPRRHKPPPRACARSDNPPLLTKGQ